LWFRHCNRSERVSLCLHGSGEDTQARGKRLDGSDGVGNDGTSQVGEEKAHTLDLAISGARYASGRLHHHRNRDSFFQPIFSMSTTSASRFMLSGPAFDPWRRSVSAFGGSPKSWPLLLRCNVCAPRQVLSLALVLVRLRPEGNKAFFSCLSNPLLPAPPDEEKVFKPFKLISSCGDYLCLFREHNFETILGGLVALFTKSRSFLACSGLSCVAVGFRSASGVFLCLTPHRFPTCN
jgi:hypothetical protein